jgi:hypothetical protein
MYTGEGTHPQEGSGNSSSGSSSSSVSVKWMLIDGHVVHVCRGSNEGSMSSSLSLFVTLQRFCALCEMGPLRIIIIIIIIVWQKAPNLAQATAPYADQVDFQDIASLAFDPNAELCDTQAWHFNAPKY